MKSPMARGGSPEKSVTKTFLTKVVLDFYENSYVQSYSRTTTRKLNRFNSGNVARHTTNESGGMTNFWKKLPKKVFFPHNS